MLKREARSKKEGRRNRSDDEEARLTICIYCPVREKTPTVHCSRGGRSRRQGRRAGRSESPSIRGLGGGATSERYGRSDKARKYCSDTVRAPAGPAAAGRADRALKQR